MALFRSQLGAGRSSASVGRAGRTEVLARSRRAVIGQVLIRPAPDGRRWSRRVWYLLGRGRDDSRLANLSEKGISGAFALARATASERFPDSYGSRGPGRHAKEDSSFGVGPSEETGRDGPLRVIARGTASQICPRRLPAPQGGISPTRLLEPCQLGRVDGLERRAGEVVLDVVSNEPEVLAAESKGPARRVRRDLRAHLRPARRRRR